jgi:type IV pilus assembly protein PilC
MALQTAQDYESRTAASEDWQGRESSAASSRHSYSQGPSSGGEGSLANRMRGFRIEFGPSRKDILHFTSQLAVMVRAGISLQDALDGICEQSDNAKFQAVLRDLKLRIEEGNSFSQALAEHPQIFTNLYVNMVAAAEASGSLSDMLQKLAEYLDQEAETRSQVKSAMVYPIIIAVMAVGVTTFLLCFVLPRFTNIFSGKEHLLPMPTILLMATSHFLRTRWYVLIPAIGAVFWAFHYFVGTTTGRLWWDRTKLILPLISTLCRSLYITRSLHTMSVLTRAGVPILNTLSITAHISGNALFKDMWLGVYEEVRQGKKIAASLARYKLMPSSVVQMVRSGEDSGNMAEVLGDIAGFYGRELKAVTSMIEPIMICVMGVLVGFIAMSIILPIFKMSNLVTGK